MARSAVHDLRELARWPTHNLICGPLRGAGRVGGRGGVSAARVGAARLDGIRDGAFIVLSSAHSLGDLVGVAPTMEQNVTLRHCAQSTGADCRRWTIEERQRRPLRIVPVGTVLQLEDDNLKDCGRYPKLDGIPSCDTPPSVETCA